MFGKGWTIKAYRKTIFGWNRNPNSVIEDYNRYPFTKEKFFFVTIQFVFLALVISRLFYDSFWPIVPCLFLLPRYLMYQNEKYSKERIEQLEKTFVEALASIKSSLKAGYSMENALTESIKELKLYYGKEDILVEFMNIQNQIKNNQSIEQSFSTFASRSHSEDILEFAHLFVVAKKSGGNMSKIIQNTADLIREKMEVKQEIKTIMSGKVFELKVMNLVPIGIIFYISISSPGFFEPLYHSVLGVIIMTSCLIVYGLAFLLGKKILAIMI